MNSERLETARKFLLKILQSLWETRGHFTFENRSPCFFIDWLPIIFPNDFKIDDSGSIIYNNIQGVFGAQSFFGLTTDQIENLLFSFHYKRPQSEIQPKHVAEKINEILQGR